MGSDLYFFEQCETRKIERRYRKLPEDLPESLRFAHLNPKIAALLASKERGQKVDSEDPFGDGMGKKSLLPDINAAFTNVRNQFDSALSNDEDSQRFLFEEAKLSASAILRQLAQIIYFYEDLNKLIPKSLEYHLMSGYNEFTNDIVVVPREWQTQEMKEQYLARQQQELNVNSEEDFSETEINVLTGRTKSRVGTERSGSEFEKKINVKKGKGKLGTIDQGDDTESILPKSESRQGKRSDSRMSVGSQFRPQLDNMNLSRMGSRRKGSSIAGSYRSIYGQSPNMRNRMRDDVFSQIGESPSEPRSTMANPLSYMQTINFQLSNTAFEDKGWIMLKGRQEEVDQSQILEYCVQRLQESLKSMTTQATKEVDQGYDKPVIVRYYGDAKKETLLKYRKSPKMTPIQGNKPTKPKVPSIIDEKNEGKKLMQASHIDGSTVIYYPSGRPAIMYSAAGFGRPGFYTIVYEDGIDSRMLACFTPSGRGVCYFDNGIIRFLSTEKGGHLTENNGKLVRKWKWPQANVKITEPISFQVNNHIMFRCVGQTQMTIVFNCQRETSRFSVGLTADADEYKPIEETDQLLTAFTFSSKAAKDLMRIFAPSKKTKKRARKKKKDKSGKGSKHDLKKQVSFVEHPFESNLNSLKPKFNARRVSPDQLLQRRPILLPDTNVSVQKKHLNDKDTNDTEKTNNLCLSPSKQRHSFSPNPVQYQSPSSNKQESKGGKASPEGRPKSTSNDQTFGNMKTGISRRQSITPEPVKLNSLGLEYCKRKRSQSARKHSVKVYFQEYRRVMRKGLTKAPEKPLKQEPKISEESNLYIQTDAYTYRWEHKRIKDEETRKLEKEAYKQTEAARQRRKNSVLKKVGTLDMNIWTGKKKTDKDKEGKDAKMRQDRRKLVMSSNANEDKSVKLGGKCHSAKSKVAVIVDQEGANRRAHSAASYKEHSINLLKVETANPDYGQTSRAETDEQFESNIMKVCSATENKSEKDNGARLKEKIKSDEITSLKSNANAGDKSTPETKNETPVLSSVKNIPKIIIEAPDGTRKTLLEVPINIADEDEKTDNITEVSKLPKKPFRKRGLSVFQAPTVANIPNDSSQTDETDDVMGDEPAVRPAMFRKRGMSMFAGTIELSRKSDNADDSETIPKGRRESTVMQSILAFRKNVLKKKGVILSESEEESSEEDDSDSQTSKSQSSEILKLLQDFPDKVHYELEADKELARLQRKAKILVDDWMEHYRIAVGLISCSLQGMKDQPNYSIGNRNIKSARHSDYQLEVRRAVLGVEDHVIPKKKNRIPSAPLDGLGNEYVDEDFQAELSARHGNTAVCFEEKTQAAAGDGTMTPTATAIINRLAENAGRRSAKSRASTARSSSPARQQAPSVSERIPSATLPTTRSHCPLVIRQQILGYEKPQCRCSRHHIPFILDLELDDFINTETPEGQLSVIMVVSSLFPGITKAEEMLNEIYSNQNRNRTRPCVQSRSDMFRVFKYDINSAAEMSDHTQPLLMTRHNVVPGMILIYCDGRLYFCDHIFNGYGNTRKDFKKQLMKSRHDAIHGNALPKDFRFSPSKGKSGMRSAWGGEIGGAGVDKYSSTGTVVDNSLHPIHRPNSDSSDGELSAGVHLDAVKLQAAQYLSMSLSTTGFQPAVLTPQPTAVTSHLQPV